MRTKIEPLLGAALSLLATFGSTDSLVADRIAFYAPVVATSTSKSKGATVTTITTNNQIFSMEADATDVKQLTSGTVNCFFPRWDTGQKHILFYRGSDLCIMDADGSNPFVVATGTGSAGADWSPDGKQVCYPGRDATGWSGLVVVSVDPTARTSKSKVGTPVLVRKGSVYGPDWSPAGDKIAFSSYPTGGTPYLTVLDLTTGTESTFGSFKGLTPSWNSDGTELAFSGEVGVGDTGISIWELFVTSPDFVDMVQVTNFGNTFVVWTTWGPGDQDLAFRVGTGREGDAAIYKLSLSSGSAALLRGLADAPSWRP